jgi:multiple sugar transport system permease protein
MGAVQSRRWFLVPGVIFLLAIDMVPLAYSLWVSFYQWWLVRPRDIRFLGLGNYLMLAVDPAFRRSVLVTCTLTFGAVLAEFLAGLALALLFAQPFRFLRPLRAVVMMPLFVVPVVGATMWRLILHPEMGILNFYLGLLGLGNPQWLANSTMAMCALILVDSWRTIPFMFLVILAGLETLPAELYEAARVDGASWLQAFRFITVPLLAYIMLVAVLIRGMDVFREFDIVFVLTGGGPGTATETIQMLNYRVFGLGHMGQANAIGIITLILVALMCYLLILAVQRSR